MTSSVRLPSVALSRPPTASPVLAATDSVAWLSVADLNNFAVIFNRMQQMRVVPFDLRSAGHLLGSTFGSIATALPLIRFEGTLGDWLSFFARIFGP